MLDEPRRRRSPGWVRALDNRQLHGLAGRLDREQRQRDPSAGQEWLWGAVLSELEYRWRHPRGGELRCSCEWCISPFLD